jgi:hypothetical protein
VTASTYFPLVAGLASADPNALLSGLVDDEQVKDVNRERMRHGENVGVMGPAGGMSVGRVRVAGPVDEGSRRRRSRTRGDIGAAGPQEDRAMHHQPPILTPLNGEGHRVTGDELLAAVGELLSQRLPDVPPGDPYRPALVALASAAGCRPRAQRQRLEAL